MQLDFSLLVPSVKSPAKKNLLFDFSVFNATLFWDNAVSLCTWEKDSVSRCLNELRTKYYYRTRKYLITYGNFWLQHI